MWDEKYSAEHYVYGKEPNRFLADYAVELPPGDILCLAEGEGRNAVYLAGLGFNVTAVDQSPVGMDKAQRLAAEKGVEIHTICADLADYDFGTARWDGIVSIFGHVAPAVRHKVYAELHKALKPGGILLLEAYTPDQLGRGTGGPRSADLLLTADILRAEIPGLDFLHLEELEREVIEGTGHSGLSAVVQLVARKP
ncbi:cyclopropane-fatty-acyl-phospholipid synthase family protein [Thioalkalivibrio sp. XN279]|uniref:SAM-dependent methyltransferase n=1 Tax=Thioalkalivibrio sp. XN279 TaxID=2714953 RepID=UPI00140D270B|nr:class I SAM-dependent methyltransferase [Thioalkalivibrio sp. XN279]NHA15763.1 class I SAM-dependent methyltransferase [Thioalkalivibrio sp. XN279]